MAGEKITNIKSLRHMALLIALVAITFAGPSSV